MGRARAKVLVPEDFMATSSEFRLSSENVMTTASSTHRGRTISRIVGRDRIVESMKSTKFRQLLNMDSRLPKIFAISTSITMASRHSNRYFK